MDWANILGKYMDRQESGNQTNPGSQHIAGDSVHRDFDDVARKAPKESLASGIADAFRSNQTPPFGQMIAHLFSQANPEQRAGIVSKLLAIAPGAVAGSLAGMFGKNREVSPQDASNMSPDMVRQVADEAAKRDPNIIDRVSEFLADHPSLLKNLDVGSLSTMLGGIGRMMGGGRTMGGGGGR